MIRRVKRHIFGGLGNSGPTLVCLAKVVLLSVDHDLAGVFDERSIIIFGGSAVSLPSILGSAEAMVNCSLRRSGPSSLPSSRCLVAVKAVYPSRRSAAWSAVVSCDRGVRCAA